MKIKLTPMFLGLNLTLAAISNIFTVIDVNAINETTSPMCQCAPGQSQTEVRNGYCVWTRDCDLNKNSCEQTPQYYRNSDGAVITALQYHTYLQTGAEDVSHIDLKYSWGEWHEVICLSTKDASAGATDAGANTAPGFIEDPLTSGADYQREQFPKGAFPQDMPEDLLNEIREFQSNY